MKKYSLLALLVCLTPVVIYAQSGTVDNTKTVQSDILNREMNYSVYLPESYHTSTRDYPVMYLLHGMTGDHSDWINLGEVQRIAGSAIADGSAPEMIIIMPDGLYDAFYINNYDGSIRWEDFFHEEFMPEIETRYRITTQRNGSAIAGLSMGGYGAMYHGIKYKEKFGSIYAMSAAFLEVEPKPEEERNDREKEFHRKIWGPYNAQGFPENYKEHSIQEMFKAMEPIETGQRNRVILPQIFIDCGDDDFLIQQNMNLVSIMNEKNVTFEFRVRNGAHTWEYWRTALEKTMVFAGDIFRN